ncbi:hypothetical protein ASPVEDRAFT_76470 [Aspergillus versicolor CBS 583.65]|uniref:Yeast cell wall synthesis Kre9/Knh1-like N-terminal domain-containing protein n=1 Tax=Aspergillus versicolor CBS 583.65 TaxID=1036611 RepID=A0A1L9Q1H7_ASPVE|nr:uncharacterized protein ASPVEDRAFT_76470 [Aspergillus versicolor CBS 583.65]OJJ07623.1 hypothetical protein ASPVEDRAFT_76470 [Aspergillus versicolor CBS 583.65]
MVRVSTIAGAAILVVSASCLHVISPSSGSELDLSGTTKVEWSSSDSDPSTFNLYLLNKDIVPSINLKIASNLTTSDEEYTFDGVDVLPGSGYIFNLKDVSTNDILAQSDEFTVVSHGDNTTTSSAATTATATSTDGGSASSTDEPNGAATGLPVAWGVMSVVVGIMCAF